ncbi:hypothetical protein H4Q26_007808 [Puccinia striiformis f. sp. tritici PST-130]|nr:hypothetical protein H4Q26_007808 [Puccinia striiformis f. sp. tritici PST-130]
MKDFLTLVTYLATAGLFDISCGCIQRSVIMLLLLLITGYLLSGLVHGNDIADTYSYMKVVPNREAFIVYYSREPPSLLHGGVHEAIFKTEDVYSALQKKYQGDVVKKLQEVANLNVDRCAAEQQEYHLEVDKIQEQFHWKDLGRGGERFGYYPPTRVPAEIFDGLDKS